MSKPTILVAGATGTNGRALISALSEKQASIRALVRNRQKAEGLFSSNVDLTEGDLLDLDSLSDSFVGVDKCYVVTAVLPNTIELFKNLYTAAKAADVRQLVKFSGLGASISSPSEVIRQHGETDNALMESGVPYTIIRPNSFYQNMLFQADSIARTDQFYLPLSDGAQSIIDVRDIAEITANILTNEGHIAKTYNLTGPEAMTFHRVASIIGLIRGKPVTYVPITREAAEEAMKGQGMPEWSAHALAEIQALFGTGMYANVEPDAEILLGRKPRSFESFVRDHATAFAAAS